MFALTALASRSCTRTALPSERFRLRPLFCSKWRLPWRRRRILPVPVILNRFATDFLVLARPAFLDIRGRENTGSAPPCKRFSIRNRCNTLELPNKRSDLPRDTRALEALFQFATHF